MVTAFIKYGAPGFYFTSWNPSPFELPASFDFYQTQREPNSGYFGMFFSFAPPPDKPGYTWETIDIRAEKGDQISFYQHIVRQELTLHKKQWVYYLGKTIPFFNMTPGHIDDKINYETFLGVGRGAFNRTFGERESGTTAYHLYQFF